MRAASSSLIVAGHIQHALGVLEDPRSVRVAERDAGQVDLRARDARTLAGNPDGPQTASDTGGRAGDPSPTTDR